MSDTEDGEPFDKEAEKEKLRQQLEREEENRRTTQHMSELLLKGATMTNKHCDACGDPLFRHDGREFCPTCGAEAGSAGGEDAAADVESAGSEATEREGVEVDDRGETGHSDDAVPDRPSVTSAADAPETAAGGVPQSSSTTPTRGVPSGDVGEARQALVRKLSALAREAEATDDVGRTRELLAATREAAEALAAIDSLRG